MITFINCLASIVTALATIALAIVGYRQLKKLNISLTDSNLMSNFEIEFELNRRKEALTELRLNNEFFINEHKGENNEQLLETIQLMHNHYNECLENYLNIFDRLCFYILKNKLNDDDFRTEYREMLSNTIFSNKDFFQAGTIYRNMIKLNDKWQSI